MADNRAEIHYAYPHSSAAGDLGVPHVGGFYVTKNTVYSSSVYKTVEEAEQYCRKMMWEFKPHKFPPTA